MAVLRFIASLLLLIAVIAFVADVTRSSSESGPFQPTTIAQQWRTFAPDSMKAAKVTVGRALHPLVWDPVIVGLINMPVFMLFGILGVFAGYMGRRQHRVNIFTN